MNFINPLVPSRVLQFSAEGPQRTAVDLCTLSAKYRQHLPAESSEAMRVASKWELLRAYEILLHGSNHGLLEADLCSRSLEAADGVSRSARGTGGSCCQNSLA